MKKAVLLLTILFLPAIVYFWFALGIPKVMRSPVYGPRKVIEVIDPKTGEKSTDTLYHKVAAFSCQTAGGALFDSHRKLDGRSYVAVFLPPDSISTMLAIMGEDMKLNHKSYGYSRFVFFLQSDSAGNAPADAPDVGRGLGFGPDTAFTVFVTPAAFDSLHDKYYFIADPSRKKDPWQTRTDAVLIDRIGRVRGYYNIRYAAEVRKMKEDVNHILMRDESVQTLEESEVEQKR